MLSCLSPILSSEYHYIESRPPLVNATAIPNGTVSSLPPVAEAVHNCKLATAAAATAAANATRATVNSASNAIDAYYSAADDSIDHVTSSRFPTYIPSCPHCGASNAATRTKTQPTVETWGLSALLFVIFMPLCWVPLVNDACKETGHYCTRCNRKVGNVKPFSDCCVKEMR